MCGQGRQIRRIRNVTGPGDTPEGGTGRFMSQISVRGSVRRLRRAGSFAKIGPSGEGEDSDR